MMAMPQGFFASAIVRPRTVTIICGGMKLSDSNQALYFSFRGSFIQKQFRGGMDVNRRNANWDRRRSTARTLSVDPESLDEVCKTSSAGEM